MKIIITENQHTLLRRYHMIKDQVYKQMNISDPCYYNDYFDFDRYKRNILQSSINKIIDDDGLDIDQRVWTDFRNELLYELNGVIKKYYIKYLKENCRPRW